MNLTTEGGNGGNARSLSTSITNDSNGISSAASNSAASGGSGGNIVSADIVQGDDGGNAFAQATTRLNNSSVINSVRATASSVGGHDGTNTGGGFGGRGGSATAIAEVFGASNANSTATATPGNAGQRNTAGTALATSRITNGTGRANALIGLNTGFISNSSVSATAIGASPVAGSGVEARISLGSPSQSSATQASISSLANENLAVAQSLVADSGLQSVANVDILPDSNAIDQAFSGNTGVASDFDLTGGSDVLALMSIGAMQDGSIDFDSFSNSVRLSMDMSQLATQQDLILGFMNPVFTGNGFDSMSLQIYQESDLIIDQIFSDVFSADSFFNDQTFNSGGWSQGLVGALDLTILVDFDITSTGDSFYFDMTYGNSTTGSGVVPIPAAVWLFASGILVLSGFARKKRL